MMDLLRQALEAAAKYLTLRQAQQIPVVVPPTAPAPAPVPIMPVTPPAEVLSFATPKEAWHATRVMCDNAGLSLAQKNTICACIYQESQFYNTFGSGQPVKHQNIVNGKVSSTDWGIVQINDYYHIGAGKDFPSVDYVIAHPEKTVAFMIRCLQGGQISLWSSYSTGAFKKWLSLSSPMWALAARG